MIITGLTGLGIESHFSLTGVRSNWGILRKQFDLDFLSVETVWRRKRSGRLLTQARNDSGLDTGQEGEGKKKKKSVSLLSLYPFN